MTAKEEAKKLVDKMYQAHSSSASDITKYFAKQCALIAVDEIENLMYESGNRPEFTKKYWQEVKQEIEKL